MSEVAGVAELERTEQSSRDEVLEVVSRYEWYQSIPLPHGVVTPGRRGSGEQWARLQVSDAQLRGKRVLDIGCNAGFFCFESKRRGADRVMGIDREETRLAAAGDVRQLLGLDVEFRCMDVMDLAAETVGTFDLTFCLAAFQHFTHPFHALQKIADVTEECLVMYLYMLPALSNIPLLYLRNPGRGPWLTEKAARYMLEGCGFRRIELDRAVGTRAWFVTRRWQPSKERVVVKAWK